MSLESQRLQRYGNSVPFHALFYALKSSLSVSGRNYNKGLNNLGNYFLEKGFWTPPPFIKKLRWLKIYTIVNV